MGDLGSAQPGIGNSRDSQLMQHCGGAAVLNAPRDTDSHAFEGFRTHSTCLLVRINQD